jgi:3-oxoacyl-[acyl-carrier protein] reductase
MDMGIAGKTALVCAASKGLGRACAHALASEGVQVTITARTAVDLEKTAAEISAATGARVQAAPGDITSEDGRAAALAICPAPDILVNNAGGPPAGDFREWDREDWVSAVDANMIAPILLTKAVIDGMIDRKFGRVVNITSYSVKRPLPPLGLSNGARAGLTGFVAGLSRDTVKHNVTVNNLLPGPFETGRLTSNIADVAERKGIPVAEEADLRRAANPAGRFGDPTEFGAACLFLCSAMAGFITGQNLVLDGGETWGTM